MESEPIRVAATGGWTFLIGREFERLDNGDSVQAVHDTRVVYVSSLRVGKSDRLPPAAELRAAAARRLGPGERVVHTGRSVQGDAEIRQERDAWRLRGTMCADGTVATCAIDFQSPEDRSWAVEVWKSLQWDGGAA